MRHKHTWVPSVNMSCPRCGGLLELCSYGSCLAYKCIKNGHKFKLNHNKWKEPILVEAHEQH